MTQRTAAGTIQIYDLLKKQENGFEPGICNIIKQPLRRTLVRSVLYATNQGFVRVGR